jgi:hypothetical protein
LREQSFLWLVARAPPKKRLFSHIKKPKGNAEMARKKIGKIFLPVPIGSPIQSQKNIASISVKTVKVSLPAQNV